MNSKNLAPRVFVGWISLTVILSQSVYSQSMPSPWENIARWKLSATSCPIRADGKLISEVRFCREVAISSSDEVYYFCGHEDDISKAHWYHEPFNVSVRLQNHTLTRLHEFCRMVEVTHPSTGAALPEFVINDIVFSIVPRWPLKDYPPPALHGTIFPVDCASQSELYECPGSNEVINGQDCYLLQAKTGQDKIWIARDKSLCVVRREIFDLASKSMVTSVDARRIQEVADSCWLPTEIEVCDYHAGRVTSKKLTTLANFQWNDQVSSAVFVPNLKPGTIEKVSHEKFVQATADGTDYLDEVADFYRNHLGLPKREPEWNHYRTYSLNLLLGIGAGVCLAYAAKAIWK